MPLEPVPELEPLGELLLGELLPGELLLGELLPALPVEPELLGDELLGELELPAPLLPLFMADSNSVRLNRPSASVSAALKSRPETPDASLESTYPFPSRSIERNELVAEPDAEPLLPAAPVLPDAPVLEEPAEPLEDGDEEEPEPLDEGDDEGADDDPELPVDGELDELPIEPDEELSEELDLLPAATATPETADRAKAKSTALLINFMRGLLA